MTGDTRTFFLLKMLWIRNNLLDWIILCPHPVYYSSGNDVYLGVEDDDDYEGEVKRDYSGVHLQR